MKKAIKFGTHAPLGSAKAQKAKKKKAALAAKIKKSASKAKKKAKVAPKKDTPDTDGFTSPGNTWNKDREPNIGEDGIDQIKRNDEQTFLVKIF